MTKEKQTGTHNSSWQQPSTGCLVGPSSMANRQMETEKNKRKFDRLSEVVLQVFADQTDDEYPDTEGIGYHALGDRGWIGYIEWVNGPGAEACYDFQATCHELRVVAKYWYRELTDIDLFWFLQQTTGSNEWRTAIYATRRLHRIRRIIGDALIDEAIAEVDAEFRQELGDTKWEQFKAQR